MAWRSIVGSIVEESLRRATACAREGEPVECAKVLLAAADAIYAPLKPVDSGLGEARRVASMLAAIVSNSFLAAAEGRENAEDFLRAVLAGLEELRGSETPIDEAAAILEAAGAAAFTPAVSKEARETIYTDVKSYVEPPQPQVRRRRRAPRRPDPRQNLRRVLRELGRRDPILAKQVSQVLRSIGLL